MAETFPEMIAAVGKMTITILPILDDLGGVELGLASASSSGEVYIKGISGLSPIANHHDKSAFHEDHALGSLSVSLIIPNKPHSRISYVITNQTCACLLKCGSDYEFK